MRADRLSRARIALAARAWIGTPYHHQASTKTVGTDCLGLVRGVYREVMGQDAVRPPAYTADWAEVCGRETLIEAARLHLDERPPDDAGVGDVVIFRMRPGAPAKHAAILVSKIAFVHATERVGAVEARLTSWWRRRLVAAFAFPGVED